MMANSNKCCQCGELKKEDELLIFYEDNYKFFHCKDCLQKNMESKSQSLPKSLQENNSNTNKNNLIHKKNEDKNLDLKEPVKNKDKPVLLNKKKRRISKKILFKQKKAEKNLDDFDKIIYKIIEEVGEKYQLLINSKLNKKLSKFICYSCKKIKSKDNKIIKFSSIINFKFFFDYIFNTIEQEENKRKLIKISQEKYNQILENKKDLINIKSNISEKNILKKKYCFICIYKALKRNNGINSLWEDLLLEEKNTKKSLEITSGLGVLINNSSKNNKNSVYKIVQNGENSNKAEKDNILAEFENKIFNDKKGNIFDLILGDEDNDNNELENSEDNNTIKNKNEDQKIKDKKEKKNKASKQKETKIIFTKTRVTNNNELNKININNNFNNITKKSFGINDKNKNINIINMNNINNINQFNEQKFMKRNNDLIHPLLFNIDYNSNNKFLKQSMINNNFGNLNNNPIININANEELLYDRLNNQLSFLKNKINLISNLNNTRIANNINNNNDLPILIANKNFKENLFYFKNSMYYVLNYMNNINDMLEKYSCINEQSLSLMDSMINGNINTDSIMQLKNNNNLFSQLLNYNYNIQRMNTELFDIISKYLNN